MEYTLLFNLVIYFTLVVLQVRNMEYYKKQTSHKIELCGNE